MTLGEHLEDLRRRILLALIGPVIGFIICFVFFREQLLSVIVYPPYPEWRLFGYDILVLERQVVSLSLRAPYSAFTTYMFISFVAGCMLAAPWSFYHIWAFISAGLHPNERRWVRLFGPASLALFASGASFFYFIVYPMVLHFLYGFGDSFNAYLATKGVTDEVVTKNTLFDGYVNFVILLTLVFGLMFELPLVVFFLGKVRLVSVATFRKYRRHVIVALVATAALVTPPDVFSQIALAVPMLLLYELGILMVAISERRRKRRES
jgi:sec-independent protein translocase protein TatC